MTFWHEICWFLIVFLSVRPYYCYYPFALGPRTCLGQVFSQVMKHTTHTHNCTSLSPSEFLDIQNMQANVCILLDVWLILVFQVPNLLWSWLLCCLSTFRWRQKWCLPNCFRDLSSVWFLDSLLTLKTRELYGPRAEWSATLNTAHRTCLRPLFCGNSCVLMPLFITLYNSNINQYKSLINSHEFYSCPNSK